MVQLASLRKHDDLRPLTRALNERVSSLQIDLTPLVQAGNARYTRVDVDVVTAMSCILMTSRATLPMTVNLPSDLGVLTGLVRGGLLFALAQREGQTAVEIDGLPRSDVLAEWGKAWNPNLASFRRRGERSDPPGTPVELAHFRADYFVIANPHLAVPSDRLAVEVSDNLAVPWIAQVVRAADSRASAAWIAELSIAAGAVIRELVYNLAVHPFSSIPGVPDIEPLRRRAFIAVYTTRGGGEESHNRVHLVVADTGHGIGKTLRPKMRRLGSKLAFDSPAALLQAMLESRLPSYGHAEGFGFERIAQLADRYDGSVAVTTNSDEDLGGLLVGIRDRQGVNVVSHPILASTGAIVHATLSMANADRDAVQADLFGTGDDG